jgi:hypothetical protein
MACGPAHLHRVAAQLLKNRLHQAHGHSNMCVYGLAQHLCEATSLKQRCVCVCYVYCATAATSRSA